MVTNTSQFYCHNLVCELLEMVVGSRALKNLVDLRIEVMHGFSDVVKKKKKIHYGSRKHMVASSNYLHLQQIDTLYRLDLKTYSCLKWLSLSTIIKLIHYIHVPSD